MRVAYCGGGEGVGGSICRGPITTLISKRSHTSSMSHATSKDSNQPIDTELGLELVERRHDGRRVPNRSANRDEIGGDGGFVLEDERAMHELRELAGHARPEWQDEPMRVDYFVDSAVVGRSVEPQGSRGFGMAPAASAISSISSTQASRSSGVTSRPRT